MSVQEIQNVLKRKFYNHKYDLQNSYIFQNGWECDFFSMTKSGYYYEIEIKVSRSDFFADFKKEKHELFKKMVSDAKFYFKKCGASKWNGSIICRTKKANLERRVNYRIHTKEALEQYDYLTNYKEWHLYERWYDIHAPCTNIRFIDLNKINCPHRFYYAVPKDLIRKEEVPAYAGLIHIDNYEAIIIKEAPFIHKRSIDLSKILLEKFYWERNELRIKLSSIQMHLEKEHSN